MTAASILYSAESAEDLRLDPIERAIADIAAGRPVVVVDDEDRENEGDLVIAAEHATPEIVAFMMSECRGLICAPMEPDELDRLERRHHRHLRLRPLHHAAAPRERHGTALGPRPPRPHLPAARPARRRPRP